MKSPSAAPHSKVVGATVGSGVGGAVAILVIWALSTYGHVTLPDSVWSSITLIISTIAAFAIGYIVPPSANDVPVQTQAKPTLNH